MEISIAIVLISVAIVMKIGCHYMGNRRPEKTGALFWAIIYVFSLVIHFLIAYFAVTAIFQITFGAARIINYFLPAILAVGCSLDIIALYLHCRENVRQELATREHKQKLDSDPEYRRKWETAQRQREAAWQEEQQRQRERQARAEEAAARHREMMLDVARERFERNMRTYGHPFGPGGDGSSD